MRLRRQRARTLARKLPYYARSLRALWAVARPLSLLGCVLGTSRRLRLREGPTLLLSARLDLLVLKECWVDDVYGLRAAALAPGDVVVDVGAGIGDFALAASATPGVTVHSFEPNPLAFRLLEQNVGRRGAAVRAARLALGTAAAYRLRGLGSGPLASAAGSDAEGIPVEARRLDDAVPHGPVALLKVDCEGLELDVLESGADVLARSQRVVVEYHRHLLDDADRRVAELLRASAFETRLRPDPYDEAIGYVDAWRPTRSTPPPGRTAQP